MCSAASTFEQHRQPPPAAPRRGSLHFCACHFLANWIFSRRLSTVPGLVREASWLASCGGTDARDSSRNLRTTLTSPFPVPEDFTWPLWH